MMNRTLLAIGVSAALLGSCQRETEGKLVELSGRIFVFNYRVATASYLVTLHKLGPLPEGSTATADFENPKDGEALTTREKIFAVDDRIVLQSPPVQCVRKDRPYAVTIRILDASDNPLQEIATSITSDVDQTVLPTKPLVIGPGYEANPEVFGAGGAVDYGKSEGCPL
jgi:hypothetical protein